MENLVFFELFHSLKERGNRKDGKTPKACYFCFRYQYNSVSDITNKLLEISCLMLLNFKKKRNGCDCFLSFWTVAPLGMHLCAKWYWWLVGGLVSRLLY